MEQMNSPDTLEPLSGTPRGHALDSLNRDSSDPISVQSVSQSVVSGTLRIPISDMVQNVKGAMDRTGAHASVSSASERYNTKLWIDLVPTHSIRGLRRSNGAAEFAGVLAHQVLAPEPFPWRGVLTERGISFPGWLPPVHLSWIFLMASLQIMLRTLRCLRMIYSGWEA